MSPSPDWSAIEAAGRRLVARVPFLVADGAAGRVAALEAGSIARAHLEALARWPRELRVEEQRVTLVVPAAERVAFLADANAVLRDAGLIVAWRNETYPVLALGTHRLLATFERAASRFWGTTTFGAHCNGYVADAGGQPTHLWIARRSANKATDPGMLDNLIGGGVPHGQTPAETVLREGWEEAGLAPEQMRGLVPGRVVRLARDIPEGFQLEDLSVFDLELPSGLVPRNQDGEVAEITLMPVAEALDRAAAGELTVDATLVLLDFALRRRLLAQALHRRLEQAGAPLWAGQAQVAR